MNLILQSIFTYMDESILFLLFCVGVWRLSGRVGLWLHRELMGGCSPEDLRRWCVWQVLFLATWSVCFKLMLPVFMHSHSGPLYKGYSQWFAGAAEFIGGLLILYAMVTMLFGGRRQRKPARLSG